MALVLRLLGPIELVAGGRSMDIGGPRQRTVLATLGLNVERVTSMDGLIAAVWGEEPPETARGQIQVCISGLRKQLAEAGHADAIRTVPPGYRLELHADDVDTLAFARLVTTATEAADTGRTADAVDALRTALALWRGPALDGVDSEVVRRGATALDEQRLTAIEERVRLDLALGQHQQLVSELHALVNDHPLRERLHELLMIALYRSGRSAEALNAYRHARDVLIEEIGVEPGQALRELELAILNRDPALNLDSPPAEPAPEPVVVTVPKQMPASVADFTGRQAEVDDIVALLTERARGYGMPVVAISGRGGVGKSSLAVRVAHELAEHFPDGQLYADLRDTSPPGQVARFLRALGIAGRAVPETLDERAALYRSTLSGKRVLVVLDDVGTEDQALPLLPGSPGCAVIMTSRVRLGSLPGAYHVDLDPLDTQTALALLNRIVGDRRVRAEVDDAQELVRLCEGLPLALRIGGARLASRPNWRIGGLVHRLRDEGRRLDELSHRSWTLRSSIALTFENLSPEARRLFRLLALVETPELHAWTAAALLDATLGDAEDVLESLVDARLLDAVEYPEARHLRYRLHDLVRVYAKELLADSITPYESEAALRRVLGGWLSLVDAAHREEYGGDYTVVHSTAPRWQPPDASPSSYIGAGAALGWWDSERAALVAAVRQAARTGFVAQCWDLALTCVTLFEVKGYFDDWKSVTELAHEASVLAGDHNGVGAMRYSMGTWCMFQSRLAEADQCFADAVDAFAEAGNEHGGALALRNAAHIDGLCGRHDRMLTKYDIALATMRAVGDRIGEAHILRNQARYWLDNDDLGRARVLLTDALSICRAEGCRRAEAQAVHTLAELYLTSGEFDRARESLHTVLRIVRDASDKIGETHALYALGVLRHREGRVDNAMTTLAHALDLATRVRERVVEAKANHVLGEIALLRTDFAAAIDHLEAARGLFADLRSSAWEAGATALLAQARDGRADSSAAGTVAVPNEPGRRGSDHRAA
ncbi:DNA-binding SARP family transcriptional activator [Actinophytocola oryzae]|uniref:DNA-binding SARP family transcriptional activator n=1 Tax=Actinophytocola oryzae TaxID=502181 RepID=A0A4R7VF81_9PSEU|nr:DNA-binding SARP family transcriptional activator [Actinophytocola oryzae]